VPGQVFDRGYYIITENLLHFTASGRVAKKPNQPYISVARDIENNQKFNRGKHEKKI
jgi:hypothetical protein